MVRAEGYPPERSRHTTAPYGYLMSHTPPPERILTTWTGPNRPSPSTYPRRQKDPPQFHSSTYPGPADPPPLDQTLEHVRKNAHIHSPCVKPQYSPHINAEEPSGLSPSGACS